MEGYKAQWSSVSGATSYDVRRSGTTTNLYHGPSTSFIIVEGLAPIDPGEVYDVQVRACNAVGCSGWTL